MPRAIATLILSCAAFPLAASPQIASGEDVLWAGPGAPLSAAGAATTPAGPLHLLLTDAPGIEELRSMVRILEGRGARLPHLFPPGAALGRLPADRDPKEIPALAGRVVILRDPGAMPAAGLDASRPDLMGVWRRLARPASPVPAGATPAPLVGDALAPPLDGFDPCVPRHASDCANRPGTSLYLAGDVSVGIVMPESGPGSPDTENWDAARQDEVVAEIVQGCHVLVTQVLPWAGLDFVYDLQRSVPVTVEPILQPASMASSWARAAVEVLGHPSARSYVEHLREAHGTDWGVAAFVADDWNDPDNRFADGARFAFAYLGGPSLWMTYGNDGWGIDRMDTVFVHEMGHSFRALDEYASSNPSCEVRGGVLGIENQNADAACLSDLPCIMRADSMTSAADGSDPDAPLLAGHCRWTQGQMGSWDEDGDNLADLRDVPPQSALDPVLPNPVETVDLVVTGRATAKPDPDEIGEDRYGGHTLNRMARAEYRLDGGTWTEATGVWGQLCAEFEVSLTDLSEGWHTLESRAVSLLCEPEDIEICDPPRERVEETLFEQTFYVNTDCPDDPWEQNDLPWDGPSVPSGVLGGLQLCAFDLDHYAVYLREGAWLELQADYVDPAVPLELVLLDPAGREILRSMGSGGLARLSLPAAATEGGHVALVLADGEHETAYQLTINAACIDDGLEPNGAAATAAELAPGSHPGLQICDGDEDWYVLGVGAGAQISASVTHESALGDLDLALLDGALTVVEESATPADLEEVSAAGLAGGLYYLRVWGAAADVDNRYDLTLAVTGCLDDTGENDDDAAQAGPAPEGGAVIRRICPFDDDWYRVDIPEPSFLRVAATFVHDQGNVELEIRNGRGDLAGASYGTGDVERLDVQRILPGTYYLRLFGRDGDSSPHYGLSLTVADPVLLTVERRDPDVLLDWSEAGVDCYQLLRSERPDDFTGALQVRTGLRDDGQEEAQEDPTRWEDLGAVDGTRLYYYKVYPSVCAGAELAATKTFDPYPVMMPGAGTSFTITVTNAGGSTISDITVRDDMTPLVASFAVLEHPTDATDASSPVGGDYDRGYLEITGFHLAPGELAVVRVLVEPVWDSTGGPNKLTHVLRNQARVTGFDTDLGGALETLTDDPATFAYPDSTDVAIPTFTPTSVPSLVSVFWNQDVDIALRVEDPCGNLLGSEDESWAECNGFVGNVERIGGCGDPWPWGWTERIAWQIRTPPPPGEFRIFVRFAEDRDSGGACLHAGPEDVVVLIEGRNTMPTWKWVVLEATDADWQYVGDLVLP